MPLYTLADLAHDLNHALAAGPAPDLEAGAVALRRLLAHPDALSRYVDLLERARGPWLLYQDPAHGYLVTLLSKPAGQTTSLHHHGEAKVAHSSHRRQRTPGEHTRAFDDGLRCTLWRAPGFLFDGTATAIGLEAPTATTQARPSVELDHDVADVAGITEATLDEPASTHDATAHTRTDDHGHEVVDPASGAEPCFGKRHGLRVVVDDRGQLGGLFHLALQREAEQRRDAQRRHRSGDRVHRAAATDTHRTGRVGGGCLDAQHEPREHRPDIALRSGHAVAHQHIAVGRHDGSSQLVAAHIDRQVTLAHTADRSC